MPARKHHYVPVFQLAGFTEAGSEEDYLFVVDMERQTIRRQRPREVGAERDYHSVEAKEGPDLLEREFSRLEGEAARVFRAIRTDLRLPEGEDFNILISFLALMAVRSPGLRANISAAMDDVAHGILAASSATPERWNEVRERARVAGVNVEKLDYETMIQLVRDRSLRFDLHPNMHATMLLSGMNAAERALHARKWCLAVASPGAGCFVCGDRPFSVMFTEPDVPPMMSPGLMVSGTEVFMPLDARLALVGVFEDVLPAGGLGREGVAWANSRTIQFSERFIVAPDDTFRWMLPDGSPAGVAELIEYSRDRDGFLERYRE